MLRRQGEDGLDGAVLGEHAFVLRFFGKDGDDRLLVVNLGADEHLTPAPEPLLAPPEGRPGTVLWSSEAQRYGGDGTFPPDSVDGLAAARGGRRRARSRPGHQEPAGEPWPELSKAAARRSGDHEGQRMKEVIRRYPWPGEGRAGWADLLSKEWLVTNGLGGYASGTVCGVPTRRFHGLLIAALPAPLGRTMMLNDVAEEVVLPDGTAPPPRAARSTKRPPRRCRARST